MACPMRFVLVAVSLLIAAVAWWRYGGVEDLSDEYGHIQAQEADGRRGRRASQEQGSSAASALKSGALTLFDMFTGRYLYNAAVKASSQKRL